MAFYNDLIFASSTFTSLFIDSILPFGFCVLSPKVIDLIDGDQTIWENEPLTKLANKKELCAYCHSGFWRPMDTLRDKTTLNDLWSKDQATWKKW